MEQWQLGTEATPTGYEGFATLDRLSVLVEIDHHSCPPYLISKHHGTLDVH